MAICAGGADLLSRWIAQGVAMPSPLPAILAPSQGTDGLRLRIQQPANQSFLLEATDNLTTADWHPVALPGLGASYPAQSREIIVDLEAGKGFRFFRTKSSLP